VKESSIDRESDWLLEPGKLRQKGLVVLFSTPPQTLLWRLKVRVWFGQLV